MTMNKNTELSAETMAFIDTICENSNTLSERENVKTAYPGNLATQA